MQAVVGVGHLVAAAGRTAVTGAYDGFRGYFQQPDEVPHQTQRETVPPVSSRTDDSLLGPETEDPRDKIVTPEGFEALCKSAHSSLLGTQGIRPPAERETANATGLNSSRMLVERRFHVFIKNVSVENLTNRSCTAYLDILFGANLIERRVRDPYTNQHRPQCEGHRGNQCTTSRVYLPGRKSESSNRAAMISEEKLLVDEFTFEWRGSYLMLEKELISVSAWKHKEYGVNEFFGSFEDSLQSVASGAANLHFVCERTIHPNAVMSNSNPTEQTLKISCILQFEEIYDFELTLADWKISDFEARSPCLKDSDDRDGAQKSWEALNMDLNEDGEGGSKVSQTFSSRGGSLGRTSPELYFWMYQRGEYESIVSDRSGPSMLKSGTPRWKHAGVLFFRGTWSELQNTELHVEMRDPMKSDIVLGKARKSLKRIMKSGQMMSEHMKCELYGQQMVKIADLEGQILIPNVPMYRQTGMTHNVQSNKLNVVVKVNKIDRIWTSEGSHVPVNTFVEVSFAKSQQRSVTVTESVNPFYQSELLFQLDLMADHRICVDLEKDPRALTQEHLDNLGPMVIDVWALGGAGNEHLGWCVTSLNELLSGECSDVTTRNETKKMFHQGHELSRETCVFSVSRELRPGLSNQHAVTKDAIPESSYGRNERADGPCLDSRIAFEVWSTVQLAAGGRLRTTPIQMLKEPLLAPPLTSHASFSIDARPDGSETPPNINDEKTNWENATKAMESDRTFQYSCKNERGQFHFLPSFIKPIKPPDVVKGLGKIHQFVRSIPFEETRQNEVAYSPPFFLRQRRGTALDHAILHASLINGIGIPAFVCIGTLWNHEPHAWVMSMEVVSKQTSGTALGARQVEKPSTPDEPKVTSLTAEGLKALSSSKSSHAADEESKEAPTLLPSGPVYSGGVSTDYRVCFWDAAADSVFLLPERLLDPHGALEYCKLSTGENTLTLLSARLPVPDADARRRRISIARALRKKGIERKELRSAARLSEVAEEGPGKAMSIRTMKHELKRSGSFSKGPASIRTKTYRTLGGRSQAVGSRYAPSTASRQSKHPFQQDTASRSQAHPLSSGMSMRWASSSLAGRSTLSIPGCSESHPFGYHRQSTRHSKSLVLPYRTIDVVFNHLNAYANIQRPDPVVIFYDVWDPTCWCPFFSSHKPQGWLS
eukprot:GHVN01013236.1.p1 GENE.GHVN01013236.1~~GHVN01013236.1.p1  ORF type:complete len:1167 (+),score=119.61 GHVN01013236.1:63-3563(+)